MARNAIFGMVRTSAGGFAGDVGSEKLAGEVTIDDISDSFEVSLCDLDRMVLETLRAEDETLVPVKFIGMSDKTASPRDGRAD